MNEEQLINLAARIEVIAGQKEKDARLYSGRRRETRLRRARDLRERAWALIEQ